MPGNTGNNATVSVHDRLVHPRAFPSQRIMSDADGIERMHCFVADDGTERTKTDHPV
jgi:hypothetical protein